MSRLNSSKDAIMIQWYLTQALSQWCNISKMDILIPISLAPFEKMLYLFIEEEDMSGDIISSFHFHILSSLHEINSIMHLDFMAEVMPLPFVFQTLFFPCTHFYTKQYRSRRFRHIWKGGVWSSNNLVNHSIIKIKHNFFSMSF